MLFLESVIPDAISQYEFWLLVAISTFTSAITAALGVGGGATLLAVMANIIPAHAIIPVHGFVQLGSNTGRIFTMRQFIQWKIVIWFTLGCVLGSFLGGQIVVALPTHWLQMLLGAFILFVCWKPFNIKAIREKSSVVLGVVTSFVAMFVGVTGIFVISSLKNILTDRHELIGTMAAMMGLQHMTKCAAFLVMGFAFAEWSWLIIFMIASGFVGTLLGGMVLSKSSNKGFALALNWVVTLLAVKLIFDGVSVLI